MKMLINEIIARAKIWVDVNPQVPYDECGWYKGYREDCSGFISMAWRLPQPGSTTYTLPRVSHQISKDELQPGDVLLNQWGGWTMPRSPDAHVVIFNSWVDSSHTHYNAYEENPYWNGAHYTTNIHYPFWSGYDTSDYVPMKLNALSNSTTPTPPLIPTSRQALLYSADWSNGLNGWTGSQEWSISNGELQSDGKLIAQVTDNRLSTTGKLQLEDGFCPANVSSFEVFAL
jgi:hypothetical protein